MASMFMWLARPENLVLIDCQAQVVSSQLYLPPAGLMKTDLCEKYQLDVMARSLRL